jgi:hypothetical protein
MNPNEVPEWAREPVTVDDGSKPPNQPPETSSLMPRWLTQPSAVVTQSPAPSNSSQQPLLDPVPSQLPSEKLTIIYRIPLIIVLLCTSVCSMYIFVARLELKCEWLTVFNESVSIVEFILALLFVYSLIAKTAWLFCSKYVSFLIAIISAVLAVCDGVISLCGEWRIPTAEATLFVLWSLAAFFFDLEAKRL